jgi:hypothetical protein
MMYNEYAQKVYELFDSNRKELPRNIALIQIAYCSNDMIQYADSPILYLNQIREAIDHLVQLEEALTYQLKLDVIFGFKAIASDFEDAAYAIWNHKPSADTLAQKSFDSLERLLKLKNCLE